MRILITGSAGFIGFHLALRLLKENHQVLGFDNLNDYYDVTLKLDRLKILKSYDNFYFHEGDIVSDSLRTFWVERCPEVVIHLAAQAGVRYSIDNPFAYVHSNLVGFQNVIELVREFKPQNFLYASSSSVYGKNSLPFSEDQNVNEPVSFYAATKISNEVVAKSYGHLYGIPNTGLRFFTVYGPFGRPDMAIFKFATLMTKGQRIPVYHNGAMLRDYTFIDDIVDGITACIDRPEINEIYNLGRGSPVILNELISILERELAVSAIVDNQPFQSGDVENTLANISKANRDFGYSPKTSLEVGLKRFSEWFLDYRSNLIQ